MRVRFLIVIFPLFLFLLGCGKGQDSADGAWLGEGKFSAAGRSLPVKAQLELLSDGTYRFLVLEPGIVALAGVENGAWTITGTQLDLAPEQGQTSEGGGVLGSVPKNFRPKSLTVEGKFESLQLKDGPMEILFTPNRSATKSLRESGDVK